MDLQGLCYEMNSHGQYSGIRTGDLLLFSGWSIPSVLIRIGTYSQWTHGAIAVWLNTANGRQLYVYEAARVRDQPCALRRGETNVGCRLVHIDQVAHLYAKIAHRPVNVRRDDAFYATLRAFMRENQGKEVPKAFVHMYLVNVGLAKRTDADKHGVLCSELCSTWLERCGAVSSEYGAAHPHHLVSPAHLADDTRYPTGTFVSPPTVIQDNGIDDAIRCAICAFVLCGLFLYILVSVEDDLEHARGYRRPGTRWLMRKGIPDGGKMVTAY